MIQEISKVNEFMTTFGQEVKSEIGFPSDAIMKLRVDLLAEEVRELAEGVEKKDMKEILDALTDIRYVLEGAILAFGLQHVVEEAFDAVHDSNMNKLCRSQTEANQTIIKYTIDGIDTYSEQKGEYFLVKRKSDGKVLKSVNWKEQDLHSILERNFKQ